jgi:hypothetical protein
MSAPVLASSSSECASYVGARIIRATIVDQCGRPVFGPRSACVTRGFVSVEISPEVEAGADYTQRTAGGDLCFPGEKGADNIKWYKVAIDFCSVDPDLYLMLNRSWKRVTNAARTTSTGWRMGGTITDQLGFALEMWPKATGTADACLDPAASQPDFQINGYFLLPWVIPLAPDNFTLENKPITWKLNGRTRFGSLWGRGPYNVTRDIAGVAAPLLDPIDPGFDVPDWSFVSSGEADPFHAELVTVKPPAPSCGAIGLWDSTATAPTGTVVADSTNTRMAMLTITNFAATGNSGTVDWGDGIATALSSSSGGLGQHTYANTLDGQAQTITYMAGDGAVPITLPFTPQTPAAGLTEPADASADSGTGSGKKK